MSHPLTSLELAEVRSLTRWAERCAADLAAARGRHDRAVKALELATENLLRLTDRELPA